MRRLIDDIRQSLSLKISFSLLFFTATIFFVSIGFMFMYSRSIIQKEVTQRAYQTLENTSLKVSRLLVEVETATHNLQWQVMENLQPDSLLAFTHRITEQNANVNGCSITTEPYFFPQYGRHFSAYTVKTADTIETTIEAKYEYYVKEWYRIPRSLGKPCWIDPFDDTEEATLSATEIITSYCVPLYTDNNKFIGVLSTDLTLQKLANVISAQKPYPNSYCIMLGKNGHFFVHPDSQKLHTQTIFSGISPTERPDIIALGHEMLAGKKGYMKVDMDGQTCLVLYQPLAHTPWSIALVCPMHDIFGGYNNLLYLVFLLIAGGLTVLLIMCRRAVDNLISPLNILAQQSRMIATGEFNVRVSPTTRRDEIGTLQNSFATMQQSLATHINHIKEVNEQTEESNKELAHANKLVEESHRKKQEFVQNMTHQIRTPLNIILGFAQVMRDSNHEMPEDERKCLNEMMEHNTIVINRMALMLLDSSPQGKAHNLQLNDLISCNEVARECIESSQHQYPSINFQLETSLPDSLCVRTNHLYLFRILRELLFNASKYANGEKVFVKVDETETSIRYTVEDIGSGIPPENREVLLNFFGKVDDFSEGLGLGLPLTKQHAKTLGGDLILDTSYKDGCRFFVNIPKTS